MTHRRDRFLVLTVSLALICSAGSGCGGGGSPDSAPPLPTDTTPPQIADITGIDDGDTITTAVVFTATATDDTGIASFRLTVGGTKVVDAARTEITYAWDVRQIVGGSYALAFTAADAAGNTDTETLNVTVLNDNMPADWEPIPDPQVEEKLTVQPVYDFDYILPPMDPALYNPDDREPPTLLLVGIKNNDYVYETCQVSATATDDTGVNVITILVDGKQMALKEGYSLRYEWDTTVYADGEHTVTFVVRDNGGTVGQCSLEVTVDNATDHTGPTIDPITDSSWTYGEFSGPLIERLDFDDHYAWEAAGIVHLRVHTSDPQGVASLTMSINDGAAHQIDSDYLEFDIPTADHEWGYWYKIEFVAEDPLGNQTYMKFLIISRNLCPVSGTVTAANGRGIEAAEVLLLPGLLDSADQVDSSTALVIDETNSKGRFYTDPVPGGKYTLYVRCGSYETIVPLVLVLGSPDFFRDLVGDDAVVLEPRYGMAVPNARVAVVTGAHDDVPKAFDIMFSTEFHALTRDSGDRLLPEAIDLVNGDNSLSAGAPGFMDFVRDRNALYKYRYIIIESGNAYEAQWLADPATVASLRGWVEDGGQLVLTGQAYDFAEQMFPTYLDFAGSAELDGLGPVAETLDSAQLAQQETFVSLMKYMFYPGSPRRNLASSLQWRGLDEVPPVFLPAGSPCIDDMGEAAMSNLRIQLGEPSEYKTSPCAATFQPELGSVVVMCMPVQQPQQDSGNLMALVLDLLTFNNYWP